MEYIKHTINISDDCHIELHFNPSLSNKPYQFRLYSFDGYNEIRLNRNELINFAEILSDFAFDNSQSTEYNDNHTGLHRLWLQRRNECLDQLEKLQDHNDER